jgi:glycosyltransferase involved in cell wall biosynthesis
MKIGMVTSWEEACGIADYSQALVEALRPYVDVRVVPIRHGQRRRAYFQEVGEACQGCDLVHIQHEYRLFGGRDPWNYHWQAMRDRLHVPYVVTAHTWLKRFTGGPVWKQGIRFLRDSLYQASGWSHYLEAGQFQDSRCLMVMSASFAREMQKRGIPKDRITTLFQGVPQPAYKGNAQAARQRWSLSGPVVVMFGFLIPSKGHLLALAAWEKIAASATLLIVGRPFSQEDEAYGREVTARAARQSRKVRMTGYLAATDLADLLAAADVVLMPYEGSTSSYSLSVALAHGCPVLASDIDCFREIYDQRPCLALFRAGDAGDLARQLETLLFQADQRKKLKQEARAWVGDHSWDRVARILLKVYEDAINEQ